jgi:gamma-glutamyltranspeptidase/glutathione hydrolase
MALRDGRVELCFGTPGGDVQQQAMLQTYLNITAFGMMPQAAVDAPRMAARSFPDSFWPHTHLLGVLEVESRVPAETRAALAALGHTVSDWPEWDWRAGGMCVVQRRADGTLLAGADSRRGGLAIGW